MKYVSCQKLSFTINYHHAMLSIECVTKGVYKTKTNVSMCFARLNSKLIVQRIYQLPFNYQKSNSLHNSILLLIKIQSYRNSDVLIENSVN